MVIVQAVMDGSTLFARFHQPGGPQQLELLADCRLLHAKAVCDRLHPQLAPLQQEQDPQTGGVSEHLVEIRHLKDDCFFRDLSECNHADLRRSIVRQVDLQHHYTCDSHAGEAMPAYTKGVHSSKNPVPSQPTILHRKRYCE